MDCSYIVRIFQVVRLKFSSLFYICGNRYRHQVPTYRWEKCKELIFVGLHKSAISIYMLDIRQIFCFYNILYPLNSTYHHLSGSNLLRILPTIISCVVRQQWPALTAWKSTKARQTGALTILVRVVSRFIVLWFIFLFYCYQCKYFEPGASPAGRWGNRSIRIPRAGLVSNSELRDFCLSKNFCISHESHSESVLRCYPAQNKWG